MLVERVAGDAASYGIVVGLVEPQQPRRVIGYGSRGVGVPGPMDGDTVFEIGSMTKVFTSLLLADAVGRGDVALDDPVAKFLPATVRMPERGGRSITLVDLATHTSGLPRLPSNLKPADPENPYADYSVAQLYQFLSSAELTRDIGAEYEYSNLGGGLLGHVLALREKQSYEALVRARVTEPLGMPSTVVALSPELRARLATGHDAGLRAVENWDLPTLAGGRRAALHSRRSVDFPRRCQRTSEHSARTGVPAHAERAAAGQGKLSIALGWHVLSTGDREIVWHNGGTGGYRTFMSYDPKTQRAVVVLSNLNSVAGVDDIGLHLLDPALPLTPRPKAHSEVALDPAVFDRYVGDYELGPQAVLSIRRQGNQFFAQLSGQPQVQIFAESEREFFLRVVDAQLSFEVGSDGQVAALVLHQGGRDQRAARQK
jgi:D-alanyl-D-alanine-carboxypeptidase/D-alanyl-D-alanine-endopeptidase